MKELLTFILTILPGFTGILSFFNTSWSNTEKFLSALLFSTLYFLGLVIYLHKKLTRVQKDFSALDTDLSQLKNEKKNSDKLVGKYDQFVHKRKLFIHHDLPELGELITEFDGHVKNSFRGQKYQEVRGIATHVKGRTIEIINKEKRDFDEQLYNIQSD
ncbi:hypothetical protein [Bacillus rhizoplanae]|uniref:hypothetical protein n=1 Tax=Bacillus rhizoplanae TaxID=2880966 RepID=UPI003D2197F5